MGIAIDIKKADVEVVNTLETEDELLAYIESLTDGLKAHVENMNILRIDENRRVSQTFFGIRVKLSDNDENLASDYGIRIKLSDNDENWASDYKQCFCLRFRKPVNRREEPDIYAMRRVEAIKALAYSLANPEEP